MTIDQAMLGAVRHHLGGTVELAILTHDEMEETGANPEDVEFDLTKIKLPQSLIDSMKEDVKNGMFMDLEGYYSQIEAIGPDGQRLTVHLKDLADQYDDEGILKILEQIEHE